MNSSRIPTLASYSQPLYELEKKLLHQSLDIESWFQTEWQQYPPPVYGSVDLRNAGFKLAPVDMNLFPAGFNNLNPDFFPISIQAAKKVLQQVDPLVKRILVIPENHTRNLPYWKNIKILDRILTQAGFEVRFGSIDENNDQPYTIELNDESGEKLTLFPIKKRVNVLMIDHFIPDVILLNNDLSSGIPNLLSDIQQPLLPPAQLGWSQRLKSKHFQDYSEVTSQFAEAFTFDPWLITPLFRHCGEVDFMQQAGLDCVIRNATTLFELITKKYATYGIKQQPFLIVKADAGTYGMAVMTVRNVDELAMMNRKQRTKMASTKGGQPVNRVIIQEGVYTFETLKIGNEQAVAEPVIYLWGEQVVGGFYRVHQGRGIDENLNAPGMQFEPLAFNQTCNEPNSCMDPAVCQNQYYIYGVVAKLSMLAAAREIKGHQPL